MQHWYVASFEVKGEKRVMVKYLENDILSSQPMDNLLKYEQQFHNCYTQVARTIVIYFRVRKLQIQTSRQTISYGFPNKKLNFFWDIVVSKSNSNRFLQKEHQLVGIKISMQIGPNKHRYSEAIQRYSITQSAGLQECLV